MSSLLVATSTMMMTSGAQAFPKQLTSATNSAVKVDYQEKMLKRYEGLNLTDIQKAQIKTILQSQRSGQKTTDRSQMMAQYQQNKQKMDALVTAKTLDTRVMNEMAEEQAARAKQRFIKRVETQHAIMQVLTAEQREKLATMQAEKQAERRAKMGNFASKRG